MTKDRVHRSIGFELLPSLLSSSDTIRRNTLRAARWASVSFSF